MHLPPSSWSSPTLSSPVTPSFVCQADGHATLDIFALAQTLLCLATSASTSPPILDIYQRLNSIDEAVQSVKDQTTRAFTALNTKVDRLLNTAEVKVAPLGPIANALDRQNRQCTAELEEFRVQLAEVAADTKELMDAIEEADTSASTKVSELRYSVLGLMCSDDETASSLSVDTPPTLSIAELPLDPILTPAGYSGASLLYTTCPQFIEPSFE
ncbi:hypothetical protein M407DRAFT_34861 [Tulasnella calospora MUT 4182]|uniref:Uncharacterized protein n=1 Tax=Tulasnella calospora MUT 4182 TaxID=1051891 RepID=A0A0C3PZY1_9AGAM|nr:hypothetical protein M407DRAFT_34861 [Tulasnella calospora MUT 4182]